MRDARHGEPAHTLREHEPAEKRRERWHNLIETVEVVVLAIVAVAAAATVAVQQLLGDVTLFNGWLQAGAAGDAPTIARHSPPGWPLTRSRTRRRRPVPRTCLGCRGSPA
jgi:hypothetical protein